MGAMRSYITPCLAPCDVNRSWLLYSYAWNSIGVLYTIWWVCVCTGGEYEWENDCCNCAHEHLLCIENLCCHNFNNLYVYTLFLIVSSVSFRRCKVTTISGRFQEISSILLQLVWTNAWPLDKSAKSLQKVSKRWIFSTQRSTFVSGLRVSCSNFYVEKNKGLHWAPTLLTLNLILWKTRCKYKNYFWNFQVFFEKSAKKFFYLRKIAYLCTLETKTTKMAKKDIKLSELPEEVTGDGVKIYHTVPGTLWW